MIIDKKAVIITIGVLLALLLLIGLVFLGRTDSDLSALDVLDNSENNGDDEPRATKYYRIVLRGDCSAEVAQLARELETMIEQETGIDCGVTYDTQQDPSRTDVIEILMGNTNRNASAVALEDLLAHDYVCKWVDGALVVGGISDSATLAALIKFKDEIVPLATASSLMSKELEFSYRHDYDVDSIKLCGFEMADYSIVCTDETLEYARILANGVAQNSGYWLEVERRTARDGVREIVIKTDASLSGYAYVDYDGEDVVVSAADIYGLTLALGELYDELLSAEQNSVSVELAAQKSYGYNSPDINVMSVVSHLTTSESSLAAINDTISYIKDSLPDIVFFGEIDSGVLDMIAYGALSDYSRVQINADSAVFYHRSLMGMTIENRTENGLTIVNLEAMHSVSCERYSVTILTSSSAVSADALSTALANNVDNADGAVVILSAPESDGVNVFSADLLTRYSACVSLGEAQYRNTVLSGKTVACGAAELEYNDSMTVAFVNTALAKTCSENFLKYIQ